MEVKGGKQRFRGAETGRTLAGDLQKERAAHGMDFIRQARGGCATSVQRDSNLRHNLASIYWPFVKRSPFTFENSHLWLAVTLVVTFTFDT